MKTEQLFIENTPAVLYGEPSDTLWLVVHGQFGCKEEALPFAEIVAPDAQVLSIDVYKRQVWAVYRLQSPEGTQPMKASSIPRWIRSS